MTYHLGVPVLRHDGLKPSFSCIQGIRTYFSSLPRPIHDEELFVVGDRVFTDVVLANRMRKSLPEVAPSENRETLIDGVHKETSGGSVGPLSILTTNLLRRESMTMRGLENVLLSNVERWIVGSDILASRRQLLKSFLLPESTKPSSPSSPWLNTWWS